MIITTTPNIEGKAIYEYLGIVTGEAIMGANVFRGLLAGISYITGGSYNPVRETALREMEQQATQRGANAIVGIEWSSHVYPHLTMAERLGDNRLEGFDDEGHPR